VLLLVLIFVLAAFGLLLVALVTGTAAWAWISVAVSVAAAGALVYDWAQRRSAIRSGGGGDRTLGGAVPPSAGHYEPPTAAIPVMGGAMMDPRTEVFQPVRPSPPVRPPVADAPETVAFRPVTPPPSSPERPSGAQPDGATAGEQWSPRVTAGGRGRSDAPKSPAAAPSGDHDGVGVNAEERTSRLGAVGPAKGRDAEGGSPDSTGPKGRRTPPARDQSEQWKPKQPAKAERPPADAGMPGDTDKAKSSPAGKAVDRSAGPDADSARTTAIPIGDQKALAERKRAAQQEAERNRANQQEAATQQEAAKKQEAERDGAKDTAPPAQEPEAAAKQESEAADTPDTPDTAAAEQGAPPPRGAPPEPEEEQADSEAEAIVAELDDEVLVIDEHPLYHLAECGLLDGNETIPLPAREAVEYGFTPCGTCSPVSTLAERNRAASSS
jgi:hypothetical protein